MGSSTNLGVFYSLGAFAGPVKLLPVFCHQQGDSYQCFATESEPRMQTSLSNLTPSSEDLPRSQFRLKIEAAPHSPLHRSTFRHELLSGGSRGCSQRRPCGRNSVKALSTRPEIQHQSSYGTESRDPNLVWTTPMRQRPASRIPNAAPTALSLLGSQLRSATV